MNLLIFLDLTYNPCKNVKFCSLQVKNVQFFLIFTHNQGKIFLILPVTRGGGTCIPSLHWEFPPSEIKRCYIHGCSIKTINNSSACSVLFLSTTRLFPAHRKKLEHETQSNALTFLSVLETILECSKQYFAR